MNGLDKRVDVYLLRQSDKSLRARYTHTTAPTSAITRAAASPGTSYSHQKTININLMAAP